MIHNHCFARFAAAWLCTFFLLGSLLTAAAQAPPAGGNPAPAPAPSNKQADKATDNGATPAQPTKRRKVITNDDLEADRARQDGEVASGEKAVHAIPGTGICDDDCADQARQMMGIGPDQEGEWQFQLTAARRSLAEDTEWPGAYADAARAVKTYCTFQYQQRAAALPSGNDYMSQVERAKRQKYAEEMGRTLSQTVANANGRINRLIQQANDDPARAAIMSVLASRLNESCNDGAVR